MVRQAHHERNQSLTVHPELVEGLIENILNVGLLSKLAVMPIIKETLIQYALPPTRPFFLAITQCYLLFFEQLFNPGICQS